MKAPERAHHGYQQWKRGVAANCVIFELRPDVIPQVA